MMVTDLTNLDQNQPNVIIFNTRKHSVNRKDLQASTLEGLTPENPALDP